MTRRLLNELPATRLTATALEAFLRVAGFRCVVLEDIAAPLDCPAGCCVAGARGTGSACAD